jgi:hypothetical protein
MSIDDRCLEYLEMFRDAKYLELSEFLKKESAACLAAFFYYLAKYEGVGHLDFLRKLIDGE